MYKNLEESQEVSKIFKDIICSKIKMKPRSAAKFKKSKIQKHKYKCTNV